MPLAFRIGVLFPLLSSHFGDCSANTVIFGTLYSTSLNKSGAFSFGSKFCFE
jgi:hypothetical protein